MRHSGIRSVARATTLLALCAASALAQRGAEQRRIEGAITRAVAPGRTAPVAGTWVVLHRVSAGGGAPIDSMRTRANGSYAFRYDAFGDTGAVYFVSTMRGGVAYFTVPTREAVMRGPDADLVVFDTTSAPLPITIRGRHIIVTSPDSSGDRRTIIEVYELSNDSVRTRVPGESQRATFEAPLPSGVTEITGGQGDVSPDAMRVEDGVVRVYAPIAPGLKQFSFIYEVPVEPRMSYSIREPVPVMEVLVEDPRGIAAGAGLVEVEPQQVEGRGFKRFLAQDVPAPSVVEITAPGEGPARIRMLLIIVGIGAALLLGLGMTFMRRGVGALSLKREATPEALAVRIAELDRGFEAIASPTEDQKAQHYVERARLKGELSALLAKRDGLA